MAKITLENLRKEYGSLTAVDGIDLTIADGSYTMILGPSGCGKSTTLRMLAGLEQPTDGDVYIDDARVTDVPPGDRNLSMVFQSLALWDHKTVRENIGFGLKMEGVAEAERNAAIDEIASLLQISEKLEQSPAALSGGQQQRVALGRSLVREPDVILLDEPLSSLDAKLQLEMRATLSKIHKEIGTTFVHVTHDQEDAMSIADEIILMNDGEVVQHGAPMELFDAPTEEFVADFIGTPGMNLLDGTVSDGAVDLGGVALTPAAETIAEHPGSAVRVGVRPNRIYPADAAPDTANTLAAEVTLVETFGDSRWYYLDVGIGEELVMKSADTAVFGTLAEGDAVSVCIGSEDIHLFDATSGRALSAA
jgi:ABC-type sugar transport system ATPase subunit